MAVVAVMGEEAMVVVEEEAVEVAMVAITGEEVTGVADLRVIMAVPTVEAARGHMDTPTVGHMAGPSVTQSIVTGMYME